MSSAIKGRADKLAAVFVYSAGAILILTAIAKLISGLGSEEVLRSFEPISRLTYRDLFFLLGSLEVLVALACFFHNSLPLRLGLVASLATCFLAYRLGLDWMGYQLPCRCIGTLTDALHISTHTADIAMKVVLAYLLLGSYGTLFWLWRQKQVLQETAKGSVLPFYTFLILVFVCVT